MKFETEIEQSKKWTIQTLRNKAATDFQKCIRAEAAAKGCDEFCVINGEYSRFKSPVGYCVCVTCGALHPWNTNKMDAGHFLAGRSNSILFEPYNCHPQCKYCNRTGGAPQAYWLYMVSAYGEDVVTMLEQLKRESVSFTRDELVAMRREYRARVKEAELQIARLS